MSRRYEFRLQSAQIEYRDGERSWCSWYPVTGQLMLQMTAEELRAVADAIEAPRSDNKKDGE